MSAESLCGCSRNPPRGVTAIHINQRKLKFEKDQNEKFSYIKNSQTLEESKFFKSILKI